MWVPLEGPKKSVPTKMTKKTNVARKISARAGAAFEPARVRERAEHESPERVK